MWLHKKIGRTGVTLTLERCGDAYGQAGARSFVFSVAVWRAPETVPYVAGGDRVIGPDGEPMKVTKL